MSLQRNLKDNATRCCVPLPSSIHWYHLNWSKPSNPGNWHWRIHMPVPFIWLGIWRAIQPYLGKICITTLSLQIRVQNSFHHRKYPPCIDFTVTGIYSLPPDLNLFQTLTGFSALQFCENAMEMESHSI